MRRNLLLAVLAALVTYTGIIPARAAHADVQPANPTGGIQITATDMSQYPLTTLVVTGPRSLTGQTIPAKAFTLTEAGATRPLSVARVADQPLEVVLVIDTSGSMAGKPLDAAKAAATAFVRRMPAGTRIAVVGFGAKPALVHGLTADPAAAVTAIGSLTAGGETALYDALAMAAGQFDPAGAARRSVVVLSDGADTASAAKRPAVAKLMADRHVKVYAAALATASTDRAALEGLSTPTGGRVVEASNPTALEAVYDTIAGELVDAYRLTYTSNAHGATAIHLALSLNGTAVAVDTTVNAPAAAPKAPPAARQVPVAGFQLAVGSAAGFLAVLLAALALLAPRRPRSRLLADVKRRRRRPRHKAVTSVARRATAAAAKSLRARNAGRSVNARLEQAGIQLRGEEAVVLLACGSVVLFAVGLFLAGLIAGLAAAVFALGVGYLFLSLAASRRRSQFADQLSDVLQLLAGSLRAGYGFLQAADAVAHQADAPACQEFHRLVVEIRLGRNPTDALQAMAARMGSRDFEWATQAIEIHRDVGGDLAEVLDTTAATIRERNMVRRQVKALSAEGRLSAIILFVLPFAVAALISVTNRGYMSELFASGAGHVMIVVGGVLMTIGFFWLRKIIRLVY